MASTHRDEISRLELLHAAHPEGLVFPHLADAYRRAGRYEQAENILASGLRLHADYASAHLVMGRLRLDQGRPDDAERSFRRVLQLDPQNHTALDQLGTMAAEGGRFGEALNYLRRLHQLKPGDALAARITGIERKAAARAAQRRLGGPQGSGPARHGGEGARPEEPGGRASGNGGAGRPGMPEPGEVVTETMAELYARQGLFDRAAAVYRQLLQAAPGDARLRGKLEQVEARVRGGERPAPRTPAPPPGPRPRPDGIGTALRSVLAWSPLRGHEGGGRVGAGSRPETRRRPGPPPAPRPSRESGRPTSSPWQRDLLPGQAHDREEGRPDARGRPQAGTGVTGVAAMQGPDLAMDDGLSRLEGADAQMKALLALSDLLVGLLEYRDPFFRGSSSLTRLLATSVAEELGLGAEERVNLALAAVLRDLGRLALGGRLLPVPRLNPTGESRRKIERHVDLALHLLEGIDLPAAVRQAVRHHHERWDGAGYPDALAGEAIPVLARILAVVDSFTAMVSPRPYRLPRKVPDAAQELKEEGGTRYDPAVVTALLRVIARREQPHLGFVQRHHILLVDPDQAGAVVSAAKLCSAGYLAEVTGDAAAARERLRRVPVAALVVSAQAGEPAAVELVRDVRSDPAFGALPIVVVDAEGVALRVRLLEAGADVCFPPGITHAELQGTLGALVRRTLRAEPKQEPAAGGDSSWLALQGDIQDFPLTWLLQVMKYDSRTAAIGIRTAAREGAIYLRRGDAVHAEIRNGGKGEPALREMLQWRKGRFTVQPDARPREQTIRTSIMHLLLTQAVAEDHAAAGIFGAVSAEG